MSRIFISYRRSDGTKDASRLAEDLGAIFGHDRVFFDQYDMQGGRSWREQIFQAMEQPPVVALLVITPNYFGETREGQLRILRDDDAVRLELRHAMAIGAHLLPALTDQVRMPAHDDLPEELRGLRDLHAPPLRSRDWRKTDLPELADAIIALGVAPLSPDWRALHGYPLRAGRVRRPGLSLRHPAVLTALAVALGGSAYVGYDTWQDREAQQHLHNGLAAYGGKDPNPLLARTEYLLAVNANPRLGAAHYYLAHLYASIPQRDEAVRHFEAAVRYPRGLDGPQITDARERLKELAQIAAEPAPVQRSVALAPQATPEAETATSPRSEPATGAAAPPAAGPQTTPPPDAAVLAEPPVAAMPAPVIQPPARVATRSARSETPTQTLPRLPARSATGIPVTIGPDGRVTLNARAVPAPTGQTQDLINRVAMTPRQHSEVEARVEQLFGGNLQARVEAASTLSTDAELISDAIPVALKRALAGLDAQRSDEALLGGVVETMRLLQKASPATLQANRPAIDTLMDALKRLPTLTAIQGGAVSLLLKLRGSLEAPRPMVYLQIADEAQRPLALQISRQLSAAGYAVPGIENVGRRAPSNTELRVQGSSNQSLARWMQRALANPTGATVKVTTLSKATPLGDAYELWLANDLCIQGGRHVAGCQG